MKSREIEIEFEPEQPSMTLMDIYYEESKLKAWRDNLIKQAASSTRKVDRLQETLNKLKGMPYQFLRKDAGFQSYEDLKASVNKLV